MYAFRSGTGAHANTAKARTPLGVDDGTAARQSVWIRPSVVFSRHGRQHARDRVRFQPLAMAEPQPRPAQASAGAPPPAIPAIPPTNSSAGFEGQYNHTSPIPSSPGSRMRPIRWKPPNRFAATLNRRPSCRPTSVRSVCSPRSSCGGMGEARPMGSPPTHSWRSVMS